MVHSFSTDQFITAGAYVYSPDRNKNIHLCTGFIYEPQNIDNNAKLCQSITRHTPAENKTSSRGVRYTTLAQDIVEKHNMLSIMVHECSHFYDIGLIGTGFEKRGQYDLVIREPLSKAYIGPYWATHCRAIAKNNPHAALCNADNFAIFIAEHTDDNYEDTYNYF